MKEKKNIDRLFQEKFKDFEVHPSDKVWENIVSAKAKKEDRKIIPIWWRLGGIAALLVLLVSIGLSVWNSTENTTNPQIVTSEKTTNEDDQNNTIDPSLSSSSDINEDLVSSSNSDTVTESSSENTPSNRITTTSALNNNNIVTNDNNPNSSTPNTTSVVTNQNGTVISSTNSPSENSQSPSNKLFTEDKKEGDNAIAVVSESQKRSDLIIDSNTPIPGEDTENAIAIAQEENTTSEDPKKSLVEEAARIASANEEKEDLEKDVVINRWDVGAVAAPVYSGDFGGSGIDPQFKDNAKSSDVNVSYGVQVSYAVNSKFKIRTGVSNVDLSYSTQDVSFSPDINPRSLEGLNPNQNTRFLSITDRVTDRNTSQDLSAQGGGTTVSDGEIQQNVGYIEIPVEAVYVLSDKRLGVEVIGGISTLLLNNNEVFLESEGLRTDLGSANSLNDVSFTTNIGLGLNYKMTEKLKINLEPSLKYQLNAYDNSVGDFKPYFIGLYTGVSYHF